MRRLRRALATVTGAGCFALAGCSSDGRVAPEQVLQALEPPFEFAGQPGFTLVARGTGFVDDGTFQSVILWNGEARATTLVSEGVLEAEITANDLASAGTATVAVAAIEDGEMAGAPGTAGLSNTLEFEIFAPPTPEELEITIDGTDVRSDEGNVLLVQGGALRLQLSTGLPVDVSNRVRWSTSDDGIVEVVNDVAQGIAEGVATVNGAIIDAEVSIELQVFGADNLLLEPAEATLEVGNGVNLFLSGDISLDRTIILNAEASWASGDQAIASVETGPTAQGETFVFVEGKAPGTTVVTASIWEVDLGATISVVVPDDPPMDPGDGKEVVAVGSLFGTTYQNFIFDPDTDSLTAGGVWSFGAPATDASRIAERTALVLTADGFEEYELGDGGAAWTLSRSTPVANASRFDRIAFSEGESLACMGDRINIQIVCFFREPNGTLLEVSGPNLPGGQFVGFGLGYDLSSRLHLLAHVGPTQVVAMASGVGADIEWSDAVPFSSDVSFIGTRAFRENMDRTLAFGSGLEVLMPDGGDIVPVSGAITGTNFLKAEVTGQCAIGVVLNTNEIVSAPLDENFQLGPPTRIALAGYAFLDGLFLSSRTTDRVYVAGIGSEMGLLQALGIASDCSLTPLTDAQEITSDEKILFSVGFAYPF